VSHARTDETGAPPERRSFLDLSRILDCCDCDWRLAVFGHRVAAFGHRKLASFDNFGQSRWAYLRRDDVEPADRIVGMILDEMCDAALNREPVSSIVLPFELT